MPTDVLPSAHEVASSLQAGRQRLAESDLAEASRAAIASVREAVPDVSRAVVTSVRDAIPYVRPRRRRTNRRPLLAVVLLGAMALSLALTLPAIRRWSEAARTAEMPDDLAGSAGPTTGDSQLAADPAGEPRAAVAAGVTGL